MPIQSNHVYEVVADGSHIRVFGVDLDRKIAAAIPIDRPLAKLVGVPLGRLGHDLQVGGLVPALYSDPAEPDALLDDRMVAYRKWMMSIMRPITERHVLDLAPKPGSEAAAALYPGQCAEIDWTVTDVVAVRRLDRTSIGRLGVDAVDDHYCDQTRPVDFSHPIGPEYPVRCDS